MFASVPELINETSLLLYQCTPDLWNVTAILYRMGGDWAVVIVVV